MLWVESVPNISEGQRADVIDACARATTAAGACLLDTSSDAVHHRTVVTLAGRDAEVAGGVLALFETALAHIELSGHRGVHPRIGAIDVVPFVPLAGATMSDCVTMARHVAQTVATAHGVPVFLYEHAATRPWCRDLADIRWGGLDALAERMTAAEWFPDYGPRHPHATAGVSVIGARPPLIAFNVNLATRDVAVARRIARAVRASSGGLPAVKAMGVDLAPAGMVQVSMNLVDHEQTSIAAAFDAVAAEAHTAGVAILESELVGLAPAAALSASVAARVHLRGYSEDSLLETRLRGCGIGLDASVPTEDVVRPALPDRARD